MTEDYTYELETCPDCGKRGGHALDCSVVQAYHPPAHECNAPGTRVALDAAHERIAALEGAIEAGEGNYQTVKTLLARVGDAKLALEMECDAAQAEVARLRDDIEEVSDMLQDTEHTDDYTARRVARALLDTALYPKMYATAQSGDLPPSE